MNPEIRKQVIIIILAIIAGIVAVFMMGTYIKNETDRATSLLARQYEKRQEDLQMKYDQQMAEFAQEIRQIRSEQANVPAGGAAPGAISTGASLALRTPEGKRAVTVLMDSLGAVGGLINPGDFVDIIGHLNVPKAKSGADSVTVMIFQNLKILAVNTNIDTPGVYNDQQLASSLKITFAVDPNEAGLLSFAEKNGKLELALRAPNEKKHHMLEASTWTTLADYVLKNHGGNINGITPKPDSPSVEEVRDVEEVKPYIQIFRGGKEL